MTARLAHFSDGVMDVRTPAPTAGVSTLPYEPPLPADVQRRAALTVCDRCPADAPLLLAMLGLDGAR